MSRLRQPIVWLLALFVGLGLAYSRVNPPFEATDELRHYRFVRTLQVDRALPVQGQEPCRSQSHHPPLFYAVGALLTAPLRPTNPVCFTPPVNPFWAYRFAEVGVDNKNQYLHPLDLPTADQRAVALLRVWNVALGALTVYAVWRIGRLWLPDRPGVALGGAALVACNPMFLYMSGAINNDVIAACSTTVLIWQLLAGADRPLTARRGAWLGLLYGLALLSKFNTLPILAVVVLHTAWTAYRQRAWRAWFVFQAALAATAVATAGWWFVRNQLLYGEPTGVRILTELWGVRAPTESWGLALRELDAAWSTLWGRFGFGQIPLPTAVYLALYALVGIGLLGRLVGGRAWSGRRAAGWVLAGTALTFFAVLFNYILISPAGAMGRFFFPGLPALALLTAAGWERWLGRAAAPALTLGMGGLAVVALLGYLRPAYAPPLRPPDAPLPHVVNLPLTGVGTLTGYAVTPTTAQPGERVTVTLDWRVDETPTADAVLFVHVLDEGGFVTQRDTYPATGRYPTRRWRADSRWRDRVTLVIPDTAAAGTATVQLGFYDPADGARLLWQTPDGERDALTLGALTITGDGRPAVRFGADLQLIDIRYSARSLPADGRLTLELVWSATAPLAADYQVQLLLLDAEGNYRGSADQTPGTAAWPVGAPVTTTHTFALSELPNPPTAGLQRLRAAVQGPDGAKLPVMLSDGGVIGDYLELAGVATTADER